MQINDILTELKHLANPANVAGMAKFGINAHNTYGISIPTLRLMAKRTGKNHALAQLLWDSGIHEARILASLVAEPQQMSEAQVEQWVMDLDSWDVCDQCCSNLFQKTLWAYPKAIAWSNRSEEFVKRSGFTLMTQLAVHDKKATNSQFEPFFPLIEREAIDERNFVKKAVNWALRQIGKRNQALNQRAIQVAETIQQLDSKSARWIAADALRELKSDAVQQRLKSKP